MLTVAFTVPGPIVGKNAVYMRLRKDVVTRSGRRMGLILSPEGRRYKNLIYQLGLRARNESDWPANPFIPKRVRVTVTMYGTRHDAGAAMGIAKDALEKLYYENDRVCCHGPEEPSIRDGSEPRIEITLELLETYTQQEAEKRQSESQTRRLRKLRKAR